MLSKNLEETHALAKRFLQTLLADPSSQSSLSAKVLTLDGDLGAGKTAFVQGLAKALALDEPIRSPTFILMKQYKIPKSSNSPWSQLVHIDAYRLESGAELKALSWQELLADPNNLIVLEWPERVAGALGDTMALKFKFIDESRREITLPDEEPTAWIIK